MLHGFQIWLSLFILNHKSLQSLCTIHTHTHIQRGEWLFTIQLYLLMIIPFSVIGQYPNHLWNPRGTDGSVGQVLSPAPQSHSYVLTRYKHIQVKRNANLIQNNTKPVQNFRARPIFDATTAKQELSCGKWKCTYPVAVVVCWMLECLEEWNHPGFRCFMFSQGASFRSE